MEALAQFFTDYPVAIGAMIASVGIFLFLLSYFDSDFVFGSVSNATYSTRKIDGLINLFGRKAARVILGALGVFLFLIGGLLVLPYINH